MATTPNSYGRFIGRVGALAVALGIGAAIANTPGIAVAQDGPSGGSDASSGSTTSSDTGSATSGSSSASIEDAEDAGSDEDGADLEETDDSEESGEGEGEETDPADDTDGEETPPTDEAESWKSGGEGDEESAADAESDASQPQSRIASQTVTTSAEADEPATEDSMRTAEVTDAQPASGEPAFAVLSQSTESSLLTSPSTVTTGLGGFVNTVLSAFGFGPQAASGPSTSPQPPMLWAMLGWVRREIGHMIAPFAAAASAPVAALVADDASIAAEDSPLATEEQLNAERLATQTANSLPVALMKLVLRQGFLAAANELYPEGPDEENLALLDEAVNEYAMGAAFQQQLLDSMRPTFVTQVAPPHIWFGQNVPGSRILYDNPDTIYRFAGVNGASEYIIRGQFLNYNPNDPTTMPADTTFSVLEGLAGTTSTILTVDEFFEINEDGTFEITVSREPGGPNHLQLTSASTIIAARNTLGNWNTEVPMSLSIERVGGPPNSLFAQIGGFAFLGPLVTSNPLLTTLVSLVPPLPMPPVVRGVFAAVILAIRGVTEQREYMALATNDPETGEAREPNVMPQPSSNAEFLANQLQSNGNFQLEDGEALVLTINPGRANYFVVPTYNIWTITDDYWNEQTSLNNEQAFANDDGTYTVVISPTDPGVTNWISTGGLNQGTISMRFQDLEPDPDNLNPPRIVSQQVVSVEDVDTFFENDPIYFVDEQERADQLAARKDGFNKRWAPFPQP